jgi:succinoglycan biosynthesis transport protein ExoP
VSHLYEALRRAGGDKALVPLKADRVSPAERRPETGVVDEDETLEIRRALWGLLRRKWQILMVAAAVVIPVAIATAMAERLYRSSALLQVDPEPAQVLPYKETDLPTVAPNYEMFMHSQEEILRGPTLVLRIASRLRAAPDKAELMPEIPSLWKRLSIQRLENTQMFRLNYVAHNPNVAAKVANIYAEEYIKLQFESRQETREKMREFLQSELETLEHRVQSSETDLVAYAQAHNIRTEDAGGANLIRQRLGALDSQLTQAESEAVQARSRLEALQNASGTSFPERLVTPVISDLQVKIDSLEHDLTALRSTFGPNWPAVIQKNRELTLVRNQLEGEKRSTFSRALEQASLDYRTAENRHTKLKSLFEDQKDLADQLEKAAIQYNIIRREVETNQKMYDGILERLRQTSVSTGMELGGFHVVEMARPSDVVDSPRTMWNLSLAAVLGLALGICIALVRNYWDTSVMTVEEIEQIGLFPLLGTLPLVPSQDDHRALLARVRERIRAGALRLPLPPAILPAAPSVDASPNVLALSECAPDDVRNVCASILLSRSQGPPRILLVTSAAPGEGKSTISIALSRALADSGAPTLLIDCDLRRGTLAKRFKLGTEGGLSLFLAGQNGMAPTMHRTDNGGLFVVTNGPSAPNPPALLASDRMQAFLRDAMSSFQFVVLDTPPVIPLADARVLAPVSDGVILAVRAGHVPKSMIRRVHHLLEAAGATVLGAVLNGADEHGPESPYYRYYRHYYKS